MSKTTILLTGASGALGAATLALLATDPNVEVIAVLRSLARSEASLRSRYASQVSEGLLSFVEIPDMTVPNAFDESARKADAIIHIATPLTYDNLMETMIKPSWAILHNVLSAAEKSGGSVKRVIVTGSMVSTMRVDDLYSSEKTISEESWNPIGLEEAELNPLNAYCYSKVSAEKKAWEFMKEKPRDFELVVLLAPSITGKSLQPGFKPDKRNLGGQPGLYRGLFDCDKPGFVYPYFMDVEDVSRVHVQALSPRIPGNERYMFHSPELMIGDDIARAVRENFPQLRDRVPAPEEGAAGAAADNNSGVSPNLVKTDMSKFEQAFGRQQWKSARDSARETVKDIVAYEERQKQAAQ
ncbi:uncharacterized protein Z520_03906 [Fonsecaea multimorphosa CBS 102226]|uniref:NAD-dependent epimerase/dehydratase domain-containing protein n=1 Tax=Fonsecaea multimorphosa CBS 102226 TaxID=1442371 RepID=A0A0D2HEA5_9EURO|nr:uncharacterized protein Z520_03906 [Fonsecaea multimorphosa CBS 102226]KIY00221.1 hypothetical protein Z520_03906 [Fonsecaea multimorphosa CBS 102226]OAL27414.1 hypothetical protein AYO22_03689 [Fonsecaea multimorphosa]